MTINNLSFNPIASKRTDNSSDPQGKVRFGLNSVNNVQSNPVNAQASVSLDYLLKEFKNDSFSNFNQYENAALQNEAIDVESKEEALSASNKGEKVGFGEGLAKVIKGFVGGVLMIPKYIGQHPIGTVATAAGLGILHRALPLVGILSPTIPSIALLLFGVRQFEKTAHSVFQPIGDGKRSEHNEQRKSLYNLGTNLFMLGVAGFFAPKAARVLKDQMKIKPKFNEELWRDIKETAGYKATFAKMDPTPIMEKIEAKKAKLVEVLSNVRQDLVKADSPNNVKPKVETYVGKTIKVKSSPEEIKAAEKAAEKAAKELAEKELNDKTAPYKEFKKSLAEVKAPEIKTQAPAEVKVAEVVIKAPAVNEAELKAAKVVAKAPVKNEAEIKTLKSNIERFEKNIKSEEDPEEILELKNKLAAAKAKLEALQKPEVPEVANKVAEVVKAPEVAKVAPEVVSKAPVKNEAEINTLKSNISRFEKNIKSEEDRKSS